MKYKAVIFDLGGTLIPALPLSDWVDQCKKIADTLSAPVEEFVKLWLDQYEGLCNGTFPSIQGYIKHICQQLGLHVQDEIINTTTNISLSFEIKEIATPRDGAIDLLDYLKSNDYKIGLITSCGPEVPALWNETPFAPFFDVTIYSCSVGMTKDDPRIFELAARQLEVIPDNCLYIADGIREELANASKTGMNAIRLIIPDEIEEINTLREDWNGPEISSLWEIRNLLETGG